MFNPRPPIADQLRLVQKQILWPFRLRLPLPPRLQHCVDSGQLKQRMVKGGIENIPGRYPPRQQIDNRLPEQRRLSDLPGA